MAGLSPSRKHSSIKPQTQMKTQDESPSPARSGIPEDQERPRAVAGKEEVHSQLSPHTDLPVLPSPGAPYPPLFNSSAETVPV